MRGYLVIALALVARTASAESLDDVIRAELAPQLTGDLGISEVHLSPALAALDVDRANVSIEVPRDVRVGRQSIKLTLRGRHAKTDFVPVSFARLVDVAVAQQPIAAGAEITADDIAMERRAIGVFVPAPVDLVVGTTANHDVVAGAVIGSHDVTLPAPLARGTQIAVDVRHGAVRIRGTGTLELAARLGQPATVRIAATNTLVHGTLVAPATLLIGE